MQIPARLKAFILPIIALFVAICVLPVSPKILPLITLAQASAPGMQDGQNIAQYAAPNLNSDVPRNQHTFVQATIIEVTSAVFCFVTGIDPLNPSQSCLDIDTTTHKLGIAPQNTGSPQIGGLLGIVPPMFAQVYVPPASSTEYIHYLADNFGIVQPAHAYTSSGAHQLLPIQAIWVAVRNVSYLLFVVIFILIGLGIMLRVKIDPRTVMTIQNQIPRIIIGILLITFSYAIVGLMIDAMWIATYTGINVITQADGDVTNPTVEGTDCENESLSLRASKYLYSSPLTYGNQVLKRNCAWGGVIGTTWGVSSTIGNIVSELIEFSIYGTKNPSYNCSWGGFAADTLYYVTPWWIGDSLLQWWFGSNALAPSTKDSCISYVVAETTGFFIKILAVLIIACIILWTFLRIWLELLKSYVMVILYTITAPLWIIMGLLPGHPLGFGSWFRRIFANLAVFPATALLMVTAAMLLNAFRGDTTGLFIPPLVGNPKEGEIGYLIAFGILLVTPGLLTILKSSLKAAGKQGLMAVGAFQSGMAAGSAVPRGIGRPMGQRLFAYDPRTQHVGAGLSWLAGPNDKGWRSRLVHFGANIPQGQIQAAKKRP